MEQVGTGEGVEAAATRRSRRPLSGALRGHAVRLLCALGLLAICVPASTASSRTPVAHLDVSAEVVWVVESVPGASSADILKVSAPVHIELHAIDTDPRMDVYPAGRDRVTATIGGRTFTEGSIEVSGSSVTFVPTEGGQARGRYRFIDGGGAGSSASGPVGRSGLAPTLDYVVDSNTTPSVRVRGWVQSGSIRLTHGASAPARARKTTVQTRARPAR